MHRYVDEIEVGRPNCCLAIRESLGEYIRGHEFRISAVHVDMIGLQLIIEPRDANAVCSANVSHIGVLPRPTYTATGITVLKHLQSDRSIRSAEKTLP